MLAREGFWDRIKQTVPEFAVAEHKRREAEEEEALRAEKAREGQYIPPSLDTPEARRAALEREARKSEEELQTESAAFLDIFQSLMKAQEEGGQSASD